MTPKFGFVLLRAKRLAYPDAVAKSTMSKRATGASPARNRVTPLGDIVAIPLRGAWTGNRGPLHSGKEIVRFHASELWITCALSFRGRWREQWLPRRFTWLYFHDEAVAFSAGHRPCGECRHKAYNTFVQAWMAGLGTDRPSARDMNRRLHSERIVRGTHTRRLHRMPWGGLPDGTFAMLDDVPHLVLGDALVPWTHAGYGVARPRPLRGDASAITPPAMVAALTAGYPVQINETAYHAAARLR